MIYIWMVWYTFTIIVFDTFMQWANKKENKIEPTFIFCHTILHYLMFIYFFLILPFLPRYLHFIFGFRSIHSSIFFSFWTHLKMKKKWADAKVHLIFFPLRMFIIIDGHVSVERLSYMNGCGYDKCEWNAMNVWVQFIFTCLCLYNWLWCPFHFRFHKSQIFRKF